MSPTTVSGIKSYLISRPYYSSCSVLEYSSSCARGFSGYLLRARWLGGTTIVVWAANWLFAGIGFPGATLSTPVMTRLIYLE